MILDKIADAGVWTVRAPLRFLYLLEVGTRMTVIRLDDDSLIIHSPIAISPELKTEVDALGGEVRFIFAPNLFHHMFVADALRAWPNAKVIASKALKKKVPDLHVDSEIESGVPSEWKDKIDFIPIHGSMLGETVLFHHASKSIVSADLFENFTTHDHGVTRMYLKLGGLYGKPGWHRMLRFMYRDKKAAKSSVEQLLELDMDRIVVAHGDIVTSDSKNVLRDAFQFLLR